MRGDFGGIVVVIERPGRLDFIVLDGGLKRGHFEIIAIGVVLVNNDRGVFAVLNAAFKLTGKNNLVAAFYFLADPSKFYSPKQRACRGLVVPDSMLRPCLGSFASNQISAPSLTFSGIRSFPMNSSLNTFPLIESGALPCELRPLISMEEPSATNTVLTRSSASAPPRATDESQSAEMIPGIKLDFFFFIGGYRVFAVHIKPHKLIFS